MNNHDNQIYKMQEALPKLIAQVECALTDQTLDIGISRTDH